jgi:GNAT superfamily N-acetyltransferase
MATIRTAELGEVPAIIPMYEWLFAPPGARPDSWDKKRAAAALAEAIESDRAEIFVAIDEAAAYVGICTVYLDLHSVRYGPRAWVEDLAVDPGRRSQGVGKALLTAAREWAFERGASHLELDSAEARPDAHRFYEREGAAYRSISFGWPL